MENLQCKICGMVGKSMITHIKYKHNMTCAEYKNIFRTDEVLFIHSEKTKRKISEILKKRFESPTVRKQLSDIQKNGASIFTKKYWMNKGMSEKEASEKVSFIQKNNCKKNIQKNNMRESSVFCVEYWVKRGHSIEIAKEKIRELQSKLSAKSPKFKGCKRTDDQKMRISKSMKNFINNFGRGLWAKHFSTVGYNGRSKSEIELFNYIKENIDGEIQANFSIENYIVDMIHGKKIIEFYGDFWHANPLFFSKNDKLKFKDKNFKIVDDIWERDRKRLKFLKNNGYEVMIIWENDWINKREECVGKIRKMLL